MACCISGAKPLLKLLQNRCELNQLQCIFASVFGMYLLLGRKFLQIMNSCQLSWENECHFVVQNCEWHYHITHVTVDIKHAWLHFHNIEALGYIFRTKTSNAQT